MTVESQRRFKRGQRQLRYTQRSLERMLPDLRDPGGLPDDKSSLRTAQQLIPAKRDHVGSLSEQVLWQRLARQTVGREVDETPAAQVDREWQARAMCDVRHRVLGDRRSEAAHDVVARMHFHEE